MVKAARQPLSAASSRPAWIMVSIGGVLIAGAIATGQLALTALASTLAFVTAVAVMAIRPPARPYAWWLLALGAAMVVYARVFFALTPGQAIAGDAALIIRVVVFWSALSAGLVLIGGRMARQDLADRLDATIIASGVFLLMWLFLLSDEVPPALRLVTPVIRPVAVAVLTGVLARLLFVVKKTPSFRFLTAGIVCALAGAFLTLTEAVRSPFPPSRIDETGASSAAYTVLLAAALLHPSAGTPLVTRQRTSSRFGPARAAVFVALILLGPFAWVVAVVPSSFKPESVWEFGLPVMITALLTLLLLWRLSLIARLADRRAGQLEDLQAELVYRATHDPLTGLGNRAELIDKLDALVNRGNGRGTRPALLLLDLDRFKLINDSLGHPVGDELLVGIGRRLMALSPAGSTVVRLGGDEFAILLPDADERDTLALAELLRTQLNQPYPTSRGDLSISASIGMCAASCMAGNLSELLRDADLALYAAKAAGKNRVEVFDHTIVKARPPNIR